MLILTLRFKCKRLGPPNFRSNVPVLLSEHLTGPGVLTKQWDFLRRLLLPSPGLGHGDAVAEARLLPSPNPAGT